MGWSERTDAVLGIVPSSLTHPSCLPPRDKHPPPLHSTVRTKTKKEQLWATELWEGGSLDQSARQLSQLPLPGLLQTGGHILLGLADCANWNLGCYAAVVSLTVVASLSRFPWSPTCAIHILNQSTITSVQ